MERFNMLFNRKAISGDVRIVKHLAYDMSHNYHEFNFGYQGYSSDMTLYHEIRIRELIFRFPVS